MVSAPEDIAGGQEKVTIAVLDTGECVAVLHRGFYVTVQPAMSRCSEDTFRQAQVTAASTVQVSCEPAR